MAGPQEPQSSEIAIGTSYGTALQDLLMCDNIVPGAAPSYQICKTIYEYHPLGAKMTEAPIKLAQSQKREITVWKGIEDDLKKAFLSEWDALDMDGMILNVKTQSRIYGIASICIVSDQIPANEPLPYDKLADLNFSFNVLDPLNTAGSLVLDQNPNSPSFQKVQGIAIAGRAYHMSRAIVVMNEKPIYISFTSSAYGFVGRSVYQRGLVPLKSFIKSMATDDMVVTKAGLLIAMIKTVSSGVDRLQKAFGAVKRVLLKAAETGNVLQIGEHDKIETLNMQNLDGAYGMARKNILENIAVSADMPAMLLNSESFAQGFADGSEDAKYVAHYISRLREEMKPIYIWCDNIAMRKAWNKNFYKTIQKKFPEQYGDVDYETAFYEWKNAFSYTWPNLLTEPDSEKAKYEDVRLKAIIALVEVLLPRMDPDNVAEICRWGQDNFNNLKLLFETPLNLDFGLLAAYVPPTPMKEVGENKPFAAADSAVLALTEAIANLPDRHRENVRSHLQAVK